MTDATREAAAAIIGDVAEESEQPEDTAAETVQQEADEELPQDIQDLLSQPDFEEDEEPVAVFGEESEEYLEPDEANKLRKQLAAAQKKTAYLEDLRVKSEAKKWKAEATKYFKYADPDTIEATSRRGFLKQAEAQHTAIKGRVEKALEEERAVLRGQAEVERQEDRQSARDAWGQPVQTHGQTPAGVEAAEKRESSLKAGRFTDSIRARLGDPDDPLVKALS